MDKSIGRRVARISWTAERVVELIRERQANGLALNYQSVVNDDEKLTGAARRLFGGWKQALEAAGIELQSAAPDRSHRRPPGYWDKARVLDELRTLQAKGIPLNAHSVQQVEGGLCAATRLFGSFEAAIEALGLDYQTVRKTEEWTPERVVQEIQRAYALGADLSDNTVSALNGALYGAAATHFLGWAQALEAASINQNDVRRTSRWSRERLLSHFRSAIERGLSVPALINWDERTYKHNVYDHFDSFADFYKALGIEEVESERVDGTRLRQARAAACITQAELGARIGYSHRAIGLYESGQVVPSVPVAIRLAEALSVTVEDLFGAKE